MRQRFIEIARAKINSSEVDVCGEKEAGAQSRIVGFAVRFLSGRFAQSGSEKGVASACRRIKSNSLSQLGNAWFFEPLYHSATPKL